MLSDFFTTFANNTPLWLLPLLIAAYVWGKYVKAGLNPDKQESFQRTVIWLRQDNFGEAYLTALGWLLDKASWWIGDRRKLNRAYATMPKPRSVVERVFGLNPFTVESYEVCLRLSFLYPLLSFFLFWSLGGEGIVGSIRWLETVANSLEIKHRLSIVVGVTVLMVISLRLLANYSTSSTGL